MWFYAFFSFIIITFAIYNTAPKTCYDEKCIKSSGSNVSNVLRTILFKSITYE